MLDQLCGRVILLQEGEIAFDGTPAALSGLYPRRALG
jgi:ABC-type multidrug transport system ATPase subunit